MNEPVPIEPGMMPSCPSRAEVAPLRVTHRSRSTCSPVRGSYNSRDCEISRAPMGEALLKMSEVSATAIVYISVFI